MKTYNNINEMTDADIMAVLNQCMRNVCDDEYNAKKEAQKKARRAQREVNDTVAFYRIADMIEKGRLVQK